MKGETEPMILRRLVGVMNSGVIVNGKVDHCPTFAVRPLDFLDVLKRNLKQAEPSITVTRCSLYGGAATFCMSSEYFFNDIDLVIHVNFDKKSMHLHLDRIKTLVLMSLREVVQECLSHTKPPRPTNLDDAVLTSAYIQKMYKHTGSACDNNIWSLFSFRNYEGRNLEVKFVHTLERCYKFSIDAWQIELGSAFLKQVQQYLAGDIPLQDLVTHVYCKFPNIKNALDDVKDKVIRVIDPQTVRGGCFLRYLDLLHKGYHPSKIDSKRQQQECDMVSRFMQDFPDAVSQQKAVSTYMQTHMSLSHQNFKMGFLKLLVSLVDRLLHKEPQYGELKAAVEEKMLELESSWVQTPYGWGMMQAPQHNQWLHPRLPGPYGRYGGVIY